MNNQGINDHVVVFPDSSTLSYMMDVCSGAPFDIDIPESWHLSLYVGKGELANPTLNHKARYRVRAVGAKVWYDDQSGQSNFVIVFDAGQLKSRHDEIERETGVKSKYVKYVPHMTIVHRLPALKRSIVSFTHSIESSVTRDGFVFTFGNETLTHSQGKVPNESGMDYYLTHFG